MRHHRLSGPTTVCLPTARLVRGIRAPPFRTPPHAPRSRSLSELQPGYPAFGRSPRPKSPGRMHQAVSLHVADCPDCRDYLRGYVNTVLASRRSFHGQARRKSFRDSLSHASSRVGPQDERLGLGVTAGPSAASKARRGSVASRLDGGSNIGRSWFTIPRAPAEGPFAPSGPSAIFERLAI